MNKDFDELAQAYDEKCQVLEIARLAYGEAIGAILNSIAGGLIRHSASEESLSGAARDLSLEPMEELCAPLRKTLKYNLPRPDGTADLTVLVRFSAPWSESPGLLQFGLLSRLDSKWAGRLGSLIQTDEWVNRPVQAPAVISGWLHAETVALSTADLLEAATRMLYDFLQLGVRTLARLRDACLDYRLEWLLAAAGPNLESDSEIVRAFPGRTIACWSPRYRYVQLNLPGEAGFWVTDETSRKSLMVGNGRRSPDFQEALQAALNAELGAKDWAEDQGWDSPGGTILDAAELAAASDERVLQVIESAFRIFVQIARRFAAAHQQESP